MTLREPRSGSVQRRKPKIKTKLEMIITQITVMVVKWENKFVDNYNIVAQTNKLKEESQTIESTKYITHNVTEQIQIKDTSKKNPKHTIYQYNK